MAFEDEDPPQDEPYRNSDLSKSDFDPFEAHRAWFQRRRRRMTTAEYLSRIDAAILRAQQAIIECAWEQAIEEAAERSGKKKRTKGYRKVPKGPSEASRWKAALAEIKKGLREKRD